VVVINFVHCWGLERYGLWLMLFALPGYLSLTDLGLSYYLSAGIPMQASKGSWRKANSLWNMGIATQLLMLLLGLLLAAGALGLVHSLTDWDATLRTIPDWVSVLLILYFYAAMAQAGIMLSVAYKAHGKLHVFTNIGTLFRFLETLASLFAGWSHLGFVSFALILLALRVANFLAVVVDLRNPWNRFRFSPRLPSRRFLRRVARPSLAHSLFPAGNALLIQTPVIIIGTVLGPAFAGQLNVVRQFPRLVTVACTILTNAIQPAIAVSVSGGREVIHGLVRKAQRGVLLLSWAGAICCLIANTIPFVGAHLFGHVTPVTLLLFLCPVLVDSFWLVRSASLTATNHHERIALGYGVFAAAAVFLNLALARTLGINSVAISGIVLSAAMWLLVRTEFRRHLG